MARPAYGGRLTCEGCKSIGVRRWHRGGRLLRGPILFVVVDLLRRAVRQHQRAHRSGCRGFDVPLAKLARQRVEVHRTARANYLDDVSPWRPSPLVEQSQKRPHWLRPGCFGCTDSRFDQLLRPPNPPSREAISDPHPLSALSKALGIANRSQLSRLVLNAFRQIKATRRNACKSTGPATEEGKPLPMLAMC